MSLCGLSAGTSSSKPLAPTMLTGSKSFTGSYGSFLNMAGLAACVVLVVSSTV